MENGLNEKTCTSIWIPPLMDIAVHGIVNWCDILRITRNWCISHDGVWIWGLIDGFELQSLMMDPEVWGFDIFGVPFILVGAIHWFASSSFPRYEIKRILQSNLLILLVKTVWMFKTVLLRDASGKIRNCKQEKQRQEVLPRGEWYEMMLARRAGVKSLRNFRAKTRVWTCLCE